MTASATVMCRVRLKDSTVGGAKVLCLRNPMYINSRAARTGVGAGSL